MPRLLSSLLVALSALVTSFSIPVHAAGSGQGQMVKVMVELTGSPLAKDLNLKLRDRHTLFRDRIDATLPSAKVYAAALQRYQGAELKYLAGQGVNLQINRQFHLLFNGFSGSVPKSQLNTLRTLKNVALVRPMRYYQPLLDKSTALVNAQQAWQKLG